MLEQLADLVASIHAHIHGAAFREARAAVGIHRRRQADRELDRAAYLKKVRGVPAHLLYDRSTGEPIDAELIRLQSAVEAAQADVEWCQAVEVACAEILKGETLTEAMERNVAGRSAVASMRAEGLALAAGKGGR